MVVKLQTNEMRKRYVDERKKISINSPYVPGSGRVQAGLPPRGRIQH